MRKLILFLLSVLSQAALAAPSLNQAIIDTDLPRDIGYSGYSGIPQVPRVNGAVKKIIKGDVIWRFDKKGRPVKKVDGAGSKVVDTEIWRYSGDSIRPSGIKKYIGDSANPVWSKERSQLSYDVYGNPIKLLTNENSRVYEKNNGSIVFVYKSARGFSRTKRTFANGHIVEEQMAGGGIGFSPKGASRNSSPETRMKYELDRISENILLLAQHTYENSKLMQSQTDEYIRFKKVWVKRARQVSPYGEPGKVSYNSYVRKYDLDKHENWIKYKQCAPGLVDGKIDWNKLGDKKCRTVTRQIEYY